MVWRFKYCWFQVSGVSIPGGTLVDPTIKYAHRNQYSTLLHCHYIP